MVFGGLEDVLIMDGIEDGIVLKITVAGLFDIPCGIDVVDGVDVKTGEAYFTTLVYLFFDNCCCCILESSTLKLLAGVKLIDVSLSLSLLLCLMYLLGHSGSRVSTIA